MQQLREHYESQDTEELLYIAGKELTDEARVILRDVLAKRGVAASEVDIAREKALEVERQDKETQRLLASRWARVVAFAIDVLGAGFALYVVLMPLRLVSYEVHGNVVSIVWLSYFLLRDCIPGQSIGKRMLGLRVVRFDSSLPCKWSTSLWRNLPHFFFIIDAVFAFGERRMRLGDFLAGTVVMRAKKDVARA